MVAVMAGLVVWVFMRFLDFRGFDWLTCGASTLHVFDWLSSEIVQYFVWQWSHEVINVKAV